MNNLLKFKRKARLSDRKAIAEVFDKPQFKAQNKSGLFLAKKTPNGFSRIVVIVGKKNIRRAVDRNRLKRVLRARFQESLKRLNEKSLDLVFVARKGALETLWCTQSDNELNKLWIRLIKNSNSCT